MEWVDQVRVAVDLVEEEELLEDFAGALELDAEEAGLYRVKVCSVEGVDRARPRL